MSDHPKHIGRRVNSLGKFSYFNCLMRPVLAFILLFSGSLSVSAQATSVLANTEEAVVLTRDFVFFKDEAGVMTLDEAARSDRFYKVDADLINFNVTSATVWARGRLTARAAGSWYLSVDPMQFSLATFYIRHKHGAWQETPTGTLLRPEERKPSVNHLLFNLELTPGDTVDVLFRIKEYLPVQLHLRAATLEVYLVMFNRMDLYNAVCYGLMIMMMIYNLYLYFVQRKRVYLYYVIYVAASLVFSAGINGHIMYLPQWVKNYAFELVPAFIPITFGVFGVLFTLDLFGDAISKRFRLACKVFIWLALLNLVISATPFKYFAQHMLQIMGLLLSVVCIGSGVSALRAKHASATYYLLGFGAYTLTLGYLILSGQNIVPNSAFVVHALITGSAIESIMLSFAAGDKLKHSEKEKERAQEEALRQAQENARIIREQNVMLEQKVKERTLELAEKNKEILDSIHYASRIQRTLLPADSYIEKRLAALRQGKRKEQ
jgi:two-component system, NtrC family, sensor kinase